MPCSAAQAQRTDGPFCRLADVSGVLSIVAPPEQSRARMNAARGAAFIKAAKGVAKAAFTKEDEADEDEEAQTEEAPENVVQMPPRNRRSRGGKRKKTEEEVKATVYRLLERSPTMSLNEIAHRGKVSVSSASKYKNQWEAENGVERDARGRLKRTRAG